MLTRDDWQIALNRVNELLRMTGDQLEEAAQRVHDPATAEWLHGLAAERLRLSGELDDYLREAGELPTRPDPDKELLVNMLAGIRDALSGEEAVPELHLQSQHEAELGEAIRDAQQLVRDDRARSLLAAASAHLERAKAGPAAG